MEDIKEFLWKKEPIICSFGKNSTNANAQAALSEKAKLKKFGSKFEHIFFPNFFTWRDKMYKKAQTMQ